MNYQRFAMLGAGGGVLRNQLVLRPGKVPYPHRAGFQQVGSWPAKEIDMNGLIIIGRRVHLR